MGKKSRRNKVKTRPRPQAENATNNAAALTTAMALLGLETSINANNKYDAAACAAFMAAIEAIDATTETFIGTDASNGAPSCCHGCPPDQTNPQSLFYNVLREYMQVVVKKSVYFNMHVGTKESVEAAQRIFRLRHWATIMDPQFVRFLFAFSAHNYLSKGIPFDNPHENPQMQRTVQMPYLETLRFGINLRYHHHPKHAGKDVSEGSELDLKFHRYCRDVDHERGYVNILAREIPCNCMDASKARFSASGKTGVCNGCCKEFPKHQLAFCKCRVTVYCSRDCQVRHWPDHKVSCKMHAKHFFGKK